MNFLWQVEAGCLEHSRPEQRVEISDVFADEVVDLGFWVFPPVVQVLSVGVAVLLSGGDVSDRGVEPDVPVIAGAVGDLKTKVGCRP